MKYKFKYRHNWVQRVFNITSPKIKVKLSKSDIWSVDAVAAGMLLPLMKKLKAEKQSAGFVDNEDVPEELRGEDEDNIFEKYNWVLDEIIWALEQSNIDWEDQYVSGTHDMHTVEVENGLFEWVKGPNDTFKIDSEGINAHYERMKRGMILFGKYFWSFWS